MVRNGYILLGSNQFTIGRDQQLSDADVLPKFDGSVDPMQHDNKFLFV